MFLEMSKVDTQTSFCPGGTTIDCLDDSCVDSNASCDGIKDCQTGIDEANCGKIIIIQLN